MYMLFLDAVRVNRYLDPFEDTGMPGDTETVEKSSVVANF